MGTNAGVLLRMLTVVCLALAVSGCEAIATIFEAGLWVGVIMAVLILGIVWFLVGRFRRP